MMRKYLISLVVLIACNHVAMACSICQFAWFDYFLPPVALWTSIAVVWFFLTVIISGAFGVRLRGMPNPASAWILLIAGLLLGFALLGPITLLPFMVPASVAFSWMFRKDRDKSLPAVLRHTIIGVGSLAVLAILAAISLAILTRKNRSMGEYIVRWSGTMPAIGKVYGLEKNEPKSLKEYRYIIEHGDGNIVKVAATRIGVIGEPQKDIPLMEEAIGRLRKTYYSTAIQDAIDSLKAREKKGKNEKDDIGKEDIKR